MKNLDNNIREIFSDKLGNMEADVSSHVWNAIQSQVAQQAAAGSTATVAAKAAISNWIWVAAAGVIATVATVITLISQEEPVAAINQPAEVKTEITATTPENNPAAPLTNSANTDNTSSQKDKAKESSNQDTKPQISLTEKVNMGEIVGHMVVGELNNQSDAGDSGNPTPSPGETNAVQNPTPVQSEQAIPEPLTAKFSTVTVDQKELRYFHIPQYVAEGSTYEWKMGDGTVYNEMSPTHQYSDQGSYTVTLTLTDSRGNTDQFVSKIEAYQPLELKMQNIVTPNGDGKNDTFTPEVLSGEVSWTRMVILSDKGQVFESDGSVMWDGTDSKGNLCPNGSYTYFFLGNLRNQAVVEKTGVVTLLR